MIGNGYPLLPLFLLALLAAPSHGRSPSGFISIDCGIAEGTGDTDNLTGIDYTSDERYVDTGEKRNVSSESRAALRYRALRSFPTGSRNCYTLRPVEKGKKYLVRAGFLYGNYDGLNRPPLFDLYLGADLWQRVNTSSPDDLPVWTEIIAVAQADSVLACLVNTGTGAPFVSVVELRPLPDRMHPMVNAFQSLVLFEERRNFGGDPNGVVRYPADPYDRLWFTPANPVEWTNLSTDMSLPVDYELQIPSAIMKTAVRSRSVSDPLEFRTARSRLADEIYVYLYFAELKQLELGANESRVMDVYLNEQQLLYSKMTPNYLTTTAVYLTNPGAYVRHNYSIRASNGSTLPPIINAMEVYVLRGLTVDRQPTNGREGFISIDCGIPEGARSTDEDGITDFASDENYVDTGENREVSPELRGIPLVYKTLRSFPAGARNCYRLRPVVPGKKYLVRAAFLYGNYDGLKSPPAFDLYLGVNQWASVNMSPSDGNPVSKEIIAIVPGDSVSLCLVKTGSSVPFISSIELRPIPDKIYPLVNASQSFVLFEDRRDYGGRPNGIVRYPDDPYDRLWFTPHNATGWVNVSTDQNITSQRHDPFQTPQAVMRTAVTTGAVSDSLNFSTAPGSADDEIYVFLHFAELKQLRGPPNETRAMDVYLNGKPWFNGLIFTELYLFAQHVYPNAPLSQLQVREFSVRASVESTLPPFVSGMEVFALKRLEAQPTVNRDVDAIFGIKEFYGIKKNWEGDPCAPQTFTWEGVNCSFDDGSPFPRIASLNLASSGLTGEIHRSIANLTNIRTLDLSQNSLTGEIPEFLADLTSLRILNLSNNKFSGLLPQRLLERSQYYSSPSSLSLSIEGNPDLCRTKDSCPKKKKNKYVIPIIAATSMAFVVLIVITLVWTLKRRRQSQPRNGYLVTSSREQGSSHLLGYRDHESRQFTYSEIKNITNNFEKQIGRGGFGTVFHGLFTDGIQVAVKMLSKLSSQGEKEFKAEVLTLLRVHHRNLVSLLGYCDDKNNLALVYEYMAQGCVVDHIRGKESNCSSLSWRVRMKIALEAAQGLEYLHSGCKPPIIHRDVKTANILLNQNLEAKIADFGLSKAFPNHEDHSHISTKTVAGTLGYLDPEYHLRLIKLNEKSDVFSFGVVLLELITGRPPILGEEEEVKIHITEWIHQRLERGDIASVADPRLQGDYDQNSIWKAVEVAISCTLAGAAQRPTMSQVVIQLKECLAPPTAPVEYPFGTDETIEMLPLSSDILTSPRARCYREVCDKVFVW